MINKLVFFVCCTQENLDYFVILFICLAMIIATNVIMQTEKYTNMYGPPPSWAVGETILDITSDPTRYVAGIAGSIIWIYSLAFNPINMSIIPVR